MLHTVGELHDQQLNGCLKSNIRLQHMLTNTVDLNAMNSQSAGYILLLIYSNPLISIESC